MAGISVRFADQAGHTEVRGPFGELHLVGETMRDGASGTVFARHLDHSWILDNASFGRAECMATVNVRLERLDGSSSKIYGPIEVLSFVDGVAYANRQVFAFVDRSIGDWYCHDDGRHWAVMIVSPA